MNKLLSNCLLVAVLLCGSIGPSHSWGANSEVAETAVPSENDLKSALLDGLMLKSFYRSQNLEPRAIRAFLAETAVFETFSFRVPENFNRNFDKVEVAYAGVSKTLRKRFMALPSDKGAPPVIYVFRPTLVRFSGTAEMRYDMQAKCYIMERRRIPSGTDPITEGVYLYDDKKGLYFLVNSSAAYDQAERVPENEIEARIRENLMLFANGRIMYFLENGDATSCAGKDFEDLMRKVEPVANERYDEIVIPREGPIKITPPGRPAISVGG